MTVMVNYGALKSGTDLKELLQREGLIIIRRANLSLNQFKALAESLGTPLKTEKHTVHDYVQIVSNKGLFEDKEVDWHNDWSYGRGKYHGTILCNVNSGHLANTIFADMAKAPKELKEKYKKEYGEYFPPQELHDKCFTEKQIKLLKKMRVRRPFVFTHNDLEILYCSLGTTDKDFSDVREWADTYNYEHYWRPGDILVWDNLRMMHKRPAFKGERTLWRVQFEIANAPI